ncbi:MAG: zinc-dependent peptidase [Tatlockia sp.]|nr:zinc-dependent peptidase [Tatlockia sp.]
MFLWLKRRWKARIIRRSSIKKSQWQKAFNALTLLNRLSRKEKIKLKKLAILFLYQKKLEAVGDLELNNFIRAVIALQACLPILNLGLDCYKGWVSVLLYPGAFSKLTKELDEFGVMHHYRVNLSGEAWQRGAVILSWQDALNHDLDNARNVVIHELAHKLDMQNGDANGFPPLHKEMSAQQWADEFNQAFSDFTLRLQQNLPTAIDAYAATSAAEFFAVFTEVFFVKPELIKESYPAVYKLLVCFYRQDPFKKS